MYRYLVFAFYQYYPTGPGDFQRAFLEFSEAQAYAQAMVQAPAADEVLGFTATGDDEAKYGQYDWAEVIEFDAESGAWTRVS